MRAFWWFKENSIAGMARPGFNAIRWLELPFDEAVLLGWIGQFSSSGSESLEDFHEHVRTYAPKIGKFHGVGDENFAERTRVFFDEAGVNGVFARLIERTGIFSGGRSRQGRVEFEFDDGRLHSEIAELKKRDIGTIVTLTERHHGREVLGRHFDVHHFSIEDLNAPKFEQAQGLAEIIRAAGPKKIAAHCLAGIGRTSTMLMAAHMILGESQEELEARLRRQNSSFALSPSQREFVQSVAQRLRN
jgi:hypothetical protein